MFRAYRPDYAFYAKRASGSARHRGDAGATSGAS